MQITIQQALDLSDAIKKLDGAHVIQIVEGKAVTVFRGHSISTSARWAFARAQGLLQTAIADFNRAKDAIIKEHAKGADSIATNHPDFPKLVAAINEISGKPVELPLEPIAAADLKMEANEKSGNEIPIAVLTALAPLIKT